MVAAGASSGLRAAQTAWGRHVYAVGDDPEAAELSGVQVKRTLISVYMLAGLICAFAGWVMIGRIGSVSPTSGQMGNIESITAVVIGGISLFGGRGSILGLLRRADRRRLLARPQAARRRRAMDLPAHRRAHHRRRHRRPVDQKGRHD
jgi:ribose/xylose/arabinose/galactoside ABC-type transport system permease subunit